MVKPIKLYSVRPSLTPRVVKEVLGLARNDQVAFVVCSTSKQAACDALLGAGMYGIWPTELSIVNSEYGQMRNAAQILEKVPGNVYALEYWGRDNSPVLKWVPDSEHIPGMEEDLGTDAPTGTWVVAGRVDDGTRPRFRIDALRKLDLDDEAEIQRFFEQIGVIALDD